jgi:CRP-like cAMP-binding protein
MVRSTAIADTGKAETVGTMRESIEKNAILKELSNVDVGTVIDDGSVHAFALRETVYEPLDRITEVYFPLDCVLSVVNLMQDGTMIEIGTIGKEGTTGIPLIMGSETTPNRAFCQVNGDAWKMRASTFRTLLDSSANFRSLVNRYLQAYVNMLGQFAACNRLHSVYERAARWILMTQDRVNDDAFPLTHEFLATMLGSRRSGVTIAAAALQNAGFIAYRRGVITVLDRSGLEATTCECYDVTRTQFGDALLLRPGAAPALTIARR